MNKFFAKGNLTRDVELRHTQDGTAVADFGLAINESWTSNGEKKEQTTFVDFSIFGKRAEVLAKFVKKGDPLLITDSKLRNESWVDKATGETRKRSRFIVNDFEFLGRKNNSTEVQTEANNSEQTQDEEESDDLPF